MRNYDKISFHGYFLEAVDKAKSNNNFYFLSVIEEYVTQTVINNYARRKGAPARDYLKYASPIKDSMRKVALKYKPKTDFYNSFNYLSTHALGQLMQYVRAEQKLHAIFDRKYKCDEYGT